MVIRFLFLMAFGRGPDPSEGPRCNAGLKINRRESSVSSDIQDVVHYSLRFEVMGKVNRARLDG